MCDVGHLNLTGRMVTGNEIHSLKGDGTVILC